MRATSRLPRPLRLAALGTAAALTLAGCSSTGDESGESEGGALKVVATTTQLTDFAKQLGGDDIELTGLLKAGASAHSFDPSPEDLLALGEADVLIVNGAGLETFIDSAVEAAGFDGLIITAADGIDLEEAKEITLETAEESGEAHDHEHEAEAEAEEHDHEAEAEEAEAEEHDHEAEAEAEADAHEHEAEADAETHEHSESEEEHDHDHGDLNPHTWTSVKFAEGMVSEIAEGLAEADADNQAAYADRAESYIAKLTELDEWNATQFDRVPEADRVLVSGHDSMPYYLHDYGVEFAGSILPSFEDNAEPSAAEIDELVAEIKEHGVKAIFVESSMSPKLAETVGEEAGVKVVDSDSLYADSLGAEGSGAETYVAATVHNTRTIIEAWGSEVDEAPASLTE